MLIILLFVVIWYGEGSIRGDYLYPIRLNIYWVE
jgi:hypothetical protein